ncbi:hypothetical protein ACOME3_005686 [Neoechinorhynchus agilis]
MDVCDEADFMERSIRSMDSKRCCHLTIARYASKCLFQISDLNKTSTGINLTKIFSTNLIRSIKSSIDTESLSFLPRLVQVLNEYKCTHLLKDHGLPIWVFIGCVNNLCSFSKDRQNEQFRSILRKLSEKYPEHVYFSFKLNCQKEDYDEYFNRLNEWLDRSTMYASFERSLSLLQDPDQSFKDWADELLMRLNGRLDSKTIKDAFASLYCTLLNTKNEFSGTFRRHFALYFRKRVESIFGENESCMGNLEKHLSTIQAEMSRYCQEVMPVELDAYSIWFNNIHLMKQKRLELPGQYDPLRGVPPEEQRCTIIGFSLDLVRLSSLRRPKRIWVRLDDGTERCIMVKSGEDLRQDEMITRIFMWINSKLSRDTRCNDLFLKTYKAVPLNRSLGIIEWIHGTCTMKTFITHGMSDDERQKAQSTSDRYSEYITRIAPVKKPISSQYLSLYSIDSFEIQKEFDRVCNLVPNLLLRKAYLNTSSSSEEFVNKRRNYIRSMAVLSVITYILGIGDRHQRNILVDLRKGYVIGIDFGCAFGNATLLLPIPELMPFRLTQQSLSPILPNTAYSLLRTLMVNALRNVRENAYELYNQLFNVSSISIQNDFSFNNYSRARMDSVKKRVEGTCPAIVTICELEHGIHRERDLKHMKNVLLKSIPQNLLERLYTGETNVHRVFDDDNVESVNAVIDSLKAKKLCVTDQVDCLIKQAMDKNILGRTWVGWEPFI